jgi:hypothetical protein
MMKEVVFIRISSLSFSLRPHLSGVDNRKNIYEILSCRAALYPGRAKLAERSKVKDTGSCGKSR